MGDLKDLGGPKRPQKEQFSKALLAIKKDVTREDRVACAKEIDRSKRTVNEYVNGHVYDLSIASKIYTFLKDAISKRSDLLK